MRDFYGYEAKKIEKKIEKKNPNRKGNKFFKLLRTYKTVCQDQESNRRLKFWILNLPYKTRFQIVNIFFPDKGQKISKANYGVLNSPKK